MAKKKDSPPLDTTRPMYDLEGALVKPGDKVAFTDAPDEHATALGWDVDEDVSYVIEHPTEGELFVDDSDVMLRVCEHMGESFAVHDVVMHRGEYWRIASFAKGAAKAVCVSNNSGSQVIDLDEMTLVQNDANADPDADTDTDDAADTSTDADSAPDDDLTPVVMLPTVDGTDTAQATVGSQVLVQGHPCTLHEVRPHDADLVLENGRVVYAVPYAKMQIEPKVAQAQAAQAMVTKATNETLMPGMIVLPARQPRPRNGKRFADKRLWVAIKYLPGTNTWKCVPVNGEPGANYELKTDAALLSIVRVKGEMTR